MKPIEVAVRCVHDSKARPLNANLRNPQQSRKTPKCAYLLAAGQVRATGREGEDIGKGEGA